MLEMNAVHCKLRWAPWLLLLVCSCWAQTRTPACACPPADKCTFRVLAVGDSLTRGAVPSQHGEHPYSSKMTEVLRAKLQGRANVQVTTSGYNFMGVIQKGRDSNDKQVDITLVPLVQQLLQQTKQNGQNYQFAVVMAGINDLGNSNQSATAIMPKLTQVYDMLLASGANVIAIPPFPNRFVSQTSDNERQRQLLVQMMKDYINSPANTRRQPRVYLQQLPPEWFDFWHMPSSRVSQMQDDLLHLTPYGYDMLGNIVADYMTSLLPPTQCLCPCGNVGASRQGRSFLRGSQGSWRLPSIFG